jgi:hypothetical protein
MQLVSLDAGEWQHAWASLPPACREVYFHPQYVRACARWEGGRPQCVVVRASADKWLLYAYVSHPIPGTQRHDVQTAYGYGGPLFVGEWLPEERTAALNRLAAHLRETGAVAEFVRCHTEWTDLESMGAAGYSVFQVRTNVECDLAGEDVTSLWAGGARRNLRRARSAGLTWRPGESARDWDAFRALYGLTAQRLEMSPGYRFDEAYFSDLARVAGVRLVIVEAVAGAMVFVGGRLAHYHLGASDFARQQDRPNELLYFAMASMARDAGCERVVWGGGLSNDPEDTLFRFKTRFGNVRRPAFCAGRVIDPAAYQELCREWGRRHPDVSSKLFLRYRAYQ